MVLTVPPGNARRRHRSSVGQSANERPHDVSPKPAKLICSRHDELMGWCEANRVDYVLGLARNRRLEAAQVDQLAEAKRRCAASGQPACVLRNFQYCTIDSWSRTVGLSARPSIRWRAPISLHRHLPQAHPRAPHSLRHRLRMSEQGRVRTRHVYLQRAFSSAEPLDAPKTPGLLTAVLTRALMDSHYGRPNVIARATANLVR